MEKNTKIVVGAGFALVAGASLYFGFMHKGKDGMTWYERVTTPTPTVNDRASAITVIEYASGGAKMTGTYGDDYLIARANALLAKQEFFYVGTRKFITKTGKETSN
ncbi:MAG TPA: hypothetical protein PK289_00015 [Bacteroidia bacterium]|nr:hypothetical protein [Bacteroidia bacterium]